MPRKYTKKTTPKIGGKKKKYSNIIPKYKINNDGGFGSVPVGQLHRSCLPASCCAVS